MALGQLDHIVAFVAHQRTGCAFRVGEDMSSFPSWVGSGITIGIFDELVAVGSIIENV